MEDAVAGGPLGDHAASPPPSLPYPEDVRVLWASWATWREALHWLDAEGDRLSLADVETLWRLDGERSTRLSAAQGRGAVRGDREFYQDAPRGLDTLRERLLRLSVLPLVWLTRAIGLRPRHPERGGAAGLFATLGGWRPGVHILDVAQALAGRPEAGAEVWAAAYALCARFPEGLVPPFSRSHTPQYAPWLAWVCAQAQDAVAARPAGAMVPATNIRLTAWRQLVHMPAPGPPRACLLAAVQALLDQPRPGLRVALADGLVLVAGRLAPITDPGLAARLLALESRASRVAVLQALASAPPAGEPGDEPAVGSPEAAARGERTGRRP